MSLDTLAYIAHRSSATASLLALKGSVQKAMRLLRYVPPFVQNMLGDVAFLRDEHIRAKRVYRDAERLRSIRGYQQKSELKAKKPSSVYPPSKCPEHAATKQERLPCTRNKAQDAGMKWSLDGGFLSESIPDSAPAFSRAAAARSISGSLAFGVARRWRNKRSRKHGGGCSLRVVIRCSPIFASRAIVGPRKKRRPCETAHKSGS